MTFEDKYISEVICVVQYKVKDDKVRLRVAEAERAFADIFPGQSQQTNVPDSGDPDLPRLILQAQNKRLAVSQKSCQLNLSVDKRISLTEQMSIVREDLLRFESDLFKFKSKEDLGECAVVLGVNIPSSDGKSSLLNHLYNRFFNAGQQTEFGELASYSFKVGYETTSKLYLNYEADVYSLHQLDFPKPTPLPQVLRVDIAEIPKIEEGIGIHVDVNNRPKATAASYVYSGIEEVMSAAFDFVDTKLDSLLGLGE